jgi:pimeloyl-ACP methyl ester carboxylesterase
MRTVAFEGLELPLWSWGDPERPAVLLVHGWSGRGSQLGAFVAPLVEAGWRVVTCDLPAHGDATGRSTHGVQLSRAVRVVAESERPTTVIAHSLGGIAATIAVHDGLALEHLILLAAPADVDFVTGYFLAASGFGVDLAPRVQRRIEKRVGRLYAEMRCEELLPAKPPRLVVIQDRGDIHVPLAHVDRWRAAWPDATVWITEHLGHFRLLSSGEVVARVVDEIAPQTAGVIPASAG